jgi:hypothetical protein
MTDPNGPYGTGAPPRVNEIPRDLFPKKSSQITREWCEATYKYFHCFDSSVRSKIYSNDDDLTKWESCAIALMDEIKDKGFLEAKNEIVRLARKRFNLKTVEGQNEIINFEEVVNLFKSSSWYNTDVDHKRYILYMFQYGIFRTTSNTWMHEAAYDWMYAHSVTYEPINKTNKPKHKTKKGFIHELLHLKSSNNIQDRFMRTCKRYLGQYLLCRDRLPNKTKDDSKEIQELTFMNYSAYLVIDKTHTSSVQSLAEDPKTRLVKCFGYAKQFGMTKQDIMRHCEIFFRTNGK